MRQCTEAIRAGQIQIQQQQVRARMLLKNIEQARDTVGLVELAVGAGRRDRAPQRGAIQREVVDDEDFVAYPQTRGRRAISRRLEQMYSLAHSTPAPSSSNRACAQECRRCSSIGSTPGGYDLSRSDTCETRRLGGSGCRHPVGLAPKSTQQRTQCRRPQWLLQTRGARGAGAERQVS